jgi:hypothetical protein
MRVGHEMYHLNNISRISESAVTIGFRGGLAKALWSMRVRIIVLIVIGALAQLLSPGSARADSIRRATRRLDATGEVGLAGGIDAVGRNLDLINGLLVLVALLTLAQLAWLLWRRTTWYVLMIESAGSVQGIMASLDWKEIHEVSRMIGNAIRNPPTQVQNYHYNNVTNDNRRMTQINQSGKNAVGQQFNSR